MVMVTCRWLVHLVKYTWSPISTDDHRDICGCVFPKSPTSFFSLESAVILRKTYSDLNMRIGSVCTVAVLLGIGALALPTAKPNGMLSQLKSDHPKPCLLCARSKANSIDV